MRLWRVGLCRSMYSFLEGGVCRHWERGSAAPRVSIERASLALGLQRDVEAREREAAGGTDG